MHRSATCLAVLLVGAAALPASAVASGKVAVRSVATARSATAGLELPVTVTAVRTGRTKATQVRIYLSSNAKHDRADTAIGSGRVPGGRAKRVRLTAQARVPSGQPLGGYRVIACAAQSCRAARGRLQITSTPVGTGELVADAVEAHRITAQQGLVYRVFAAFGDRRLPAAYSGDDAEPEDTVVRDVIEMWPKLSRSQRAKLEPFLSPPAAKGSWYSGGHASAAAEGDPVPECDTNQLADRDWRTIAQDHGHVRFWWRPADDPRLGPQVRSLVAQVENRIWPRLQGVLGREPLPDGHVKCFNGPDDKLDIYMVSLPRGRALTLPYPPHCSGTPAFIVFSSGSAPDPWELAHEIMHAFQYSYRYADLCTSYNKWDEGTANWAAHLAYPGDNSEHAYSWLARDPDRSLADASYEGWIFPLAMEELHGVETIKAIYEQTESHSVLDAIDAGLPGGFKQAWPEFALAAWNAAPVSPNFVDWDGFRQTPEAGRAPVPNERIDVGAAGQQRIDVASALPPLTRLYRHFTFGPSVSEITVAKPSFPDLSIQAVLRLRDGTTTTENWSTRQPVYCPEDPAKQPAELVLVVANTSKTVPSPASGKVTLLPSNIGCSHYRGEASGTSNYHSSSDDINESWTATGLVYDRILAGQFEVPRFIFNLTAGSVTWSLSGTQNGCSVSAGPVTLQLQPDRGYGQLDIQANIDLPEHDRRYFAQGFGLQSVPGTATCNGTTSARNFAPHTFLRTSLGFTNLRQIPADGVLQGTTEEHEDELRSATYTWRLVPDR